VIKDIEQGKPLLIRLEAQNGVAGTIDMPPPLGLIGREDQKPVTGCTVGAMAYVLQDGHKTMIPNCIGGQKSLHEL